MYKRRLKAFLILAIVAVALAIGRLAHLQGLGGAEYRRLGEDMLSDVEFLPTVRGQILDRDGRILAFDEGCYDYCLDYSLLTPQPPRRWLRQQTARIQREEKVTPQRAGEMLNDRIQTTWALAEELTGVPRNDLARAAENAVRRVEAIRRRVGMPIPLEKQPQPIVTGLDEAQAAALRARLEEMIGASIQPSYRRRYPCGQTACHLIGSLGQVAPQQVNAPEPAEAESLEAQLTGYVEGDQIGVSGVERLGEGILRGRRGYRRAHANGKVIEEVPARFGQDVHVTIDVELQQALAGILGRPGALVVLNVPTGEVLAMVSLPTYDPNDYRRQFEQLNSDLVDRPLLNRATAGRYPPGSTVKPIVALAALTENVITPATTFECRGYLNRPEEFRCFHQIRHGSLPVLNAIEQSCDVFFYNVGERVGVRRMDEWFIRFGYAEPPGTGLAGECGGRLPDARRARTAGAARFLAIGQGAAVTPLQVANATATIARGGVWLSPVVVKELADRQQERRLTLPPAHLELVRQGMHMVVNSPSGTAYKTARDDETEFSGKTGTAETPPLWTDANHNGVVDAGETVIRSGDTAWFTGYAPSKDPKIAFAIMVEYSDQAGGAICGPMARQVVRACRELGHLR